MLAHLWNQDSAYMLWRLLIKLQHLIPIGVVIIGFFRVGHCQELDTLKYKIWNENDSLQWKDYTFTDFDKILDYGFQAKAVTSLIHFYRPGIWHPDSCMNIIVAVRKKYSFTADTMNTRLLKHESIHFDIGELFARYLRKELLELSQTEGYHLEQYLVLRDSLFLANRRYQELYDEETVFGLNSKEQGRWENFIKAELKAWENYSFENLLQLCKACLINSTSK